MLRLIHGNSGYSYMVLSKKAPVLRKWYKDADWELYEPKGNFWDNVEVMLHFKEGKLSVNQEALYDEVCILR